MKGTLTCKIKLAAAVLAVALALTACVASPSPSPMMEAMTEGVSLVETRMGRRLKRMELWADTAVSRAASPFNRRTAHYLDDWTDGALVPAVRAASPNASPMMEALADGVSEVETQAVRSLARLRGRARYVVARANRQEPRGRYEPNYMKPWKFRLWGVEP